MEREKGIDLKDKSVKALKTTGYPYEVPTGKKNHPGLFLKVSATGKVSFWFRFQLDGRRKKMVVGHYPATSLKKILAKYNELADQVQNGLDPVAIKRKEEYNPTIKEFSVEYLENCASRSLSPKTLKEYRRIFDRYIFRKHGTLPSLAGVKVSELRRREISLLVNFIAVKMKNVYRGEPTTGAPTQANRVLALISGMCKYAIENELLEYNPALAVRKPGKVKTKDRYLSMEEIKVVHDIIEESGQRLIYA